MWKGRDLCTRVSIVYAQTFCHPKYSSLATKECDSALIDDEIFYLLVMTSSPFSHGHRDPDPLELYGG